MILASCCSSSLGFGEFGTSDGLKMKKAARDLSERKSRLEPARATEAHALWPWSTSAPALTWWKTSQRSLSVRTRQGYV